MERDRLEQCRQFRSASNLTEKHVRAHANLVQGNSVSIHGRGDRATLRDWYRKISRTCSRCVLCQLRGWPRLHIPFIITAIIAVHITAAKRNPMLATPVTTNTSVITNIGMQQAMIIQLCLAPSLPEFRVALSGTFNMSVTSVCVLCIFLVQLYGTQPKY